MIKNDLQSVKLKQLSEVLTDIVITNSRGDYSRSQESINRAFKQLLGVNSELALKLPTEELINLVSAYEAAEVFKLIILAELLRVQGELNKLNGNAGQWLSVYLKALNVYVKAVEMDNEITIEVAEKSIDEVINTVNEYEKPAESYIHIIRFHESTGSYDKAEDALYELLEETSNDNFAVKEAKRFYNNLLKRTEEELEAGNLSLEEVHDALNGLEKLC